MTDAMPDTVFELRRYVLHPGRRNDLIELFDREFVETQEAVGMTVVAQYRDLDRDDHFVWLRGFDDMEVRKDGLTSFYNGPVWEAHRAAAIETMIDADDVLLLRPVIAPEVVPGSRDREKNEVVTAIVFELDRPVTDDEATWLSGPATDALATSGSPPVATFATLYAENDFPRLPVRDVHRLAALVQHRDADAYAAALDALRGLDWTALDGSPVTAEPELIRLAPTPRSNALAGAGGSGE